MNEEIDHKQIERAASTVPGEIIHLAFRGSVAHGMHDPDPNSIDDIDLMGVFFAPPEHYLGISPVKETIEIKDGRLDIVFYEFKKFIRLLLKQNPNVLSLLWTAEKHTLLTSNTFSDFDITAVSAKSAYEPFRGYAHGQMKKMTRHLDNPVRAENIKALEEEIRAREAGEIVGPELPSVKSLRRKLNDLKGTSGYMGEKRRALVDKFGYDTKNAAHTIRLLKMGVDYLEQGSLIVDRSVGAQYRPPDAEELLSIKRGEWSLEQVRDYADYLFDKLEIARENSSLLQERPDFDYVNEYVQREILDYVTRKSDERSAA